MTRVGRAGRIIGILGTILLVSVTAPSVAVAELGGRYEGTGTGILLTNEVYNNAGGGGGPQYEYLVNRVPLNNCTPEEALLGGCVPGSVATCGAGLAAGPEYDWGLAEVQRRLVGADQWEELPRQCLNFAVIAPQVTPELAREQFLQLVPVLGFDTAPTVSTFVNVPVIVYADPIREWAFPPITLLGQAVLIRAVATSYTWTFGGTELVADWPGRPFADDCERLPCAGYVQSPFAEPGTYAIGLTVTWTGEFSVNGGAWQQVPGTGTSTSAASEVTVLEARAVLTDPYD